MLVGDLMFYFFSGILVFSAVLVVISSHAVFSLLFLVLSFLCSSFLLFLLECEFIALVFVVIYVGAIAVLFLFAVMMLNSKLQQLSRNVVKYVPVALLFGITFLFPILYQISREFSKKKDLSFEDIYSFDIFYKNWYYFIDSVSDVENYGQILYSYFVVQFLVVGLILLVVLLGVVYLSNTYNSKQTADQSVFKQLSVNSDFFK